MTTRPLPNILSDLRLTLEGRELKLHSVPWDEGMWSIGLETPEDSWGLFVDLEQERGRHHDSQTVEQHHGGQTYEHVRHLHDAQGTPQPFNEWLRERATKHVHHLVQGHVDKTYYRLAKQADSSSIERIIAMCRDIAALPPLPPVEWLNTQSLCDALTALIRAHDRGQMSQEEAETIRGFLDDSNEPPYRQHLRDKTIQHAFVLLPEAIPSPLRDYLEETARREVDRYTREAEITVDHVATLGRLLDLQPEHLRPIYTDAITPMINTADLCFAMATALSAHRVDALDYTLRGLKLSPRHPGLLRLSKLLRDTPEVLADSANQEQQYEALIPTVLNEIRSPNLDGNDERLLNAEASLNRFWMSMLPPRSDPGWGETVEVLCTQGRFKARGSEAYLRWCRVQGLNNQGVDYFVDRVRNVELTELQSRSDWHCSDYLAQGFSCMLDTQDPEHIQQALDIIDALEPVLTWERDAIFYALACITSRAGQLERALGYAKQSIELGHDVQPMFSDPDFANLMEHAPSKSVLRQLASARGEPV